ncbi:hypothetical protein WH52_14455 [Tenacibaculum holothuriorum]|uniref:histidine kinase n=1 Tax=Tenacibaculum holothuriorum TaxID=1635173 RepID=A0A1Y2PAX5_9FLAO|nr:HAMP domain-containing sensor histidine kinase [Tenacibaculum holothuriorum]OSY86878.1 hypothetical protein WH52_14455 [Tenacibaculum holothuriorum]
MNAKKQRWILYLISITILTTIGIQFYWNYKNYEENRLRVINEINQSLDDAIEIYFSDLSKSNFYTIVNPSKKNNANILKNIFRLDKNTSDKKISKKDTLEFKIESININTNDSSEFKKMDSTVFNSLKGNIKRIKDSHSKKPHISFQQEIRYSNEKLPSKKKHKFPEVFFGKKKSDSLKRQKDLQTFIISIQTDSIDLKSLDSILRDEFVDKKIFSDFNINHFKADTLFNTATNVSSNILLLENDAVSTFLKKDERIQIQYTNPTIEALKRSSTGILLSFILALAVISSLFYLLKIINQQKELAEIKNDLISNITHEFKTPITTVSTALEAINSFNAIDDKIKTKKYISISSMQIEKLHLMVEKLLETATLDSEKLLLKKEKSNIVELIKTLTQKHQFTTTEKELKFTSNVTEIISEIDVFHFENAISNLIDNAIKYGGDSIEIHISKVLNSIEISIADNGMGIDKNQQEKIFDKFYRVPKGNTHDVKGFGIGLYYTKKIIEKHNGSIHLTSKPNNTVFKIVLSNE